MKYKVRLNKKIFEVEVEKGEAILLDEYVAVEAKAAPAPVATTSAPQPTAAPAPVAGGANTVGSPLPGTVVNVKVSAGQAVKKGQALISCYQDNGQMLKFTGARGEVFGESKRHLQATTPLQAYKRTKILSRSVKNYVVIGKNPINFHKDSGILDASCVKIYDKKVLTIPGGFSLPVYKISVTTYRYEMVPIQIEKDDAAPWLAEYAAAYSIGQMVAGQIIGSSQEFVEDNGVLIFKAQYACYEMIGRELKEEIIN